MRATYSGPPASVRSAVTKLIRQRVVFAPTCVQFHCTVRATVTTPRGRRVGSTLASVRGTSYTGSGVMPTGLRCGRQKLWAFLTMTATVTHRQEEPGTILTGTTQAAADNPGGCKLFRGKLRAIRKVWFAASP
jgi:hypothetical protein